MSPRRSRSGRLAIAATAALATITTFAAVAPVHALTNATTTRLAGTDRYGTAAEIAKAAYPTGADTVIVASGETFPDALAGAALAARQAAPVLLTDPKTLSTATSDAITSLKSTKAVILGGTTAVSQDVQDALAKKVTVSRISGTDRYDTAAKIAAAIGSANIGSTSSRRSALIATGKDFADALAGGALAAAGSTGVLPVLLVSDTVPAPTKTALQELGITQTVILGGTAAVSAAVASDLQTITGNAPTRLAGADRYATASAIATSELATFGFSAAGVVLANGVKFADALAGGPLAGKTKTPILLTDPATLSAATKSYLNSHSDTVATITGLGGTTALSDATLAAAKTAAAGDQTGRKNETIVVAPQDKAVLVNDGQATRTYTASGLTSQVDIVLVDCSKVSTDSAGNTVLANTNANGTADGTAASGTGVDMASTNASISSVNGAPPVGATNDDYADKASPADGKVTFIVKSTTTVACVVPVVFNDADNTNSLAATTAGLPSEAFGTGGVVEFQPATANAGQFPSAPATTVTVQSVNKPEASFSAAPTAGASATYFYDADDVFKIADTTTDMATFVAALSVGDMVKGDYQPGKASTFNLTDAAPAAPGVINPQQDPSPAHSVTVSFTDSSTATTTSYIVYRALAIPGNSAAVPPTSASCPSTSTALASYAAVGNPVPDDKSTPAPPYSFKDATTAATTAYCYIVRSVDSGNVGPPPASAGNPVTTS
jgi:putative cell wall-binding protein